MNKRNAITILLVFAVVAGIAFFNTTQDPGRIRQAEIEEQQRIAEEVEAAGQETPEDAMQRNMMEMQQKQQEALEAEKAKLAELEASGGYSKTESGLLYRVIRDGDGPIPPATAKVAVNYEGRLDDGTVFDRSVGAPTHFVVHEVIPGWMEGLQMMKTGSKWELVIPSELGYQGRGAPPKIPGNATLHFTVELVEIVDPGLAGSG